MSSAKALTSFGALSDGNLESFANTIVRSLTNNPNFPTPIPTLAEVTAATEAYSQALLLAKTGNRADIATKNEKRDQLEVLLKKLAGYINYVAEGNRAMLLTSGFEVSKDREPATPLTKPEGIQVLNGENAGELYISVFSVKNAVAYVHQYTFDPDAEEEAWISTTASTSRYLISGLQSGKRYWCRVAVIGARDQVIYSDPVARIVL